MINVKLFIYLLMMINYNPWSGKLLALYTYGSIKIEIDSIVKFISTKLIYAVYLIIIIILKHSIITIN